MKRHYTLRLLTLLLTVGTSISLQLYAQGLQPFRARQYLTNVLQQAKTDSLDNAELIFAVTIGDTSGIGSLLPLPVNLAFNMNDGTNALWLYNVRGTFRGTDTLATRSYFCVALGLTPQLAFPQVIRANIDLGDLASGFGSDEPLPQVWYNSDTLASRLRNNAEFKAHKQQFPASKVTLAAIGNSSQNVGVAYVVFIGEVSIITGQEDPAAMTCVVPAGAMSTASEVICTKIPTSVDTQTPSANSINLSPNPAQDLLTLRIPVEQYEPEFSLKIISTMGSTIKTFPLTTAPGGYGISLDVSDIPSGAYMVVYTTRRTSKALPFIIQR